MMNFLQILKITCASSALALSLNACGMDAEQRHGAQSDAAASAASATAFAGTEVKTGAAAAANSGRATVDGSVGGYALHPINALYAVVNATPQLPVVVVMLTDQPDACDKLVKKVHTGNQRSLLLAALTINSVGQAVMPAVGDYTVTDANPDNRPGNFGGGMFQSLDASCANLITDPDNRPVGGIVSFNRLDTRDLSGATGSFDMTVGPQKDTLTGSFDAVYCEGLIAAAKDSTPSACEAP